MSGNGTIISQAKPSQALGMGLAWLPFKSFS